VLDEFEQLQRTIRLSDCFSLGTRTALLVYHDQDELSLRTKRGGTCTPGNTTSFKTGTETQRLLMKPLERQSDIGQAFISDAAKTDIGEMYLLHTMYSYSICRDKKDIYKKCREGEGPRARGENRFSQASKPPPSSATKIRCSSFSFSLRSTYMRCKIKEEIKEELSCLPSPPAVGELDRRTRRSSKRHQKERDIIRNEI
jgi:hypothetical protein